MNPSRMLFLILLSVIFQCCAKNLLKNDFIAVTNINGHIFDRTWQHSLLENDETVQLCQSLRNLPIFRISITVEGKEINPGSEIMVANVAELDYSLFLTEYKELGTIEEGHTLIDFGEQKCIPAIRCSRGKSIVYVLKSIRFDNGYILLWINEYFELQFLGLTLHIHNMKVIEENLAPLKDYSYSWQPYFVIVAHGGLTFLPYKYRIMELCASTFLHFAVEKIKYMKLASSLKQKVLNLPRSSKVPMFSSSKSKDFVLQCINKSSDTEYYLILNLQNKRQLYVGTGDEMPSFLVELAFNFDTRI